MTLESRWGLVVQIAEQVQWNTLFCGSHLRTVLHYRVNEAGSDQGVLHFLQQRDLVLQRRNTFQNGV